MAGLLEMFNAGASASSDFTLNPPNYLEQELEKKGIKIEDLNEEIKVTKPDVTISSGPISGEAPSSVQQSYRYPKDIPIEQDTDYVFFQFGKYIPPFSKAGVGDIGGGYADYNASTELEIDEAAASIILPMPQDLGNDTQQQWNGKQFSAIGRAAISGVAGGDLSRIGKRVNDLSGNMQAIMASLQTKALNTIPGVGGNLEMNDITGSTKGQVLNPNAELLYDSPELREIGMSWKLVPRNEDESLNILKICQMFRWAAVPSWGGQSDITASKVKDKKKTSSFKEEIEGSDGTKQKFTSSFDALGKDNFITVPHMCKFTYKRGPNQNDFLTQFKPCAISRVAVNFTPDGTYATYKSGAPVAVELTLNFVESKLLFKQDISEYNF